MSSDLLTPVDTRRVQIIPRDHGEKSLIQSSAQDLLESSRGHLVHVLRSSNPCRHTLCSDHPRDHGEKSLIQSSAQDLLESSRGHLVHVLRSSNPCRHTLCSDHPRDHGEKSLIQSSAQDLLESSRGHLVHVLRSSNPCRHMLCSDHSPWSWREVSHSELSAGPSGEQSRTLSPCPPIF